MSIILKIREIREFKKLTQDDIVQASGIKKRSYVDYENGKSDIPLSKLQKIANALDVSISDLLGEEDINFNLNTKPNKEIADFLFLYIRKNHDDLMKHEHYMSLIKEKGMLIINEEYQKKLLEKAKEKNKIKEKN